MKEVFDWQGSLQRLVNAWASSSFFSTKFIPCNLNFLYKRTCINSACPPSDVPQDIWWRTRRLKFDFFTHDWETITVNKNRHLLGPSKSRLSKLYFCTSQLQCYFVPTYPDASDQLNKNLNKLCSVQSEQGKKSVPVRFVVPHHSWHFHLTVRK